ncbi:prion-inhibition and propagation-domain-containing protein [Trichoderma sp. SZMC 28011]
MESISSIISLLSTTLQGFQYIQLARAFDNDFKLYQTRLVIIQLRLSRWAQATGFAPRQQSQVSSQDKHSHGSPPALAIKADDGIIEKIEDTLGNLYSVLRKAQEESEKWKPKNGESKCSPASEDNDLTLTPSRFKRLNMKMRKITEKRYQKATTQVESIKWALYKKEQCESVTTQLLELINQLEEFVEPQHKLEELIQEDSKAISESLRTFLEAVGNCDPRLEESAKQPLEDEAELGKISMSATNNYGLQMGINRAEMKGISFGTGNTVTNHWARV